jgi:Protein of unknown function (DUF3102)
MNIEAEQSNSLTDLAARIRIGHVAVQESLKIAVKCAMNTGDMLLEAKAQVNHGKWMDWVLEHCDMSGRTARLYMRLAKNRKVIEAVGDTADMTINTAIRLLAPPKDDDEKADDERAEHWARINVLYAEAKANTIKVMKVLRKIRKTFDNDEEFKASLQQKFPDPTDPAEIEFWNEIAEINREMVSNFSKEDWAAILSDDDNDELEDNELQDSEQED